MTDETLDVVRQMMRDAETQPAAQTERNGSAAAGRDAAVAADDMRHEGRPGDSAHATAGTQVFPDLEATGSATAPAEQLAENRRAPGALARLLALLPRRRRVTDLADLPNDWATRGPEPAHEPGPEPAPEMAAALRGLKARIAAYEPKRRHGVVLLLLALMIWRPWLIPGLLFLALWVILIVYFTVGPDRITELALGVWEWFSKRHPERAQRWLTRIQAGADRLDGWLAALPESWTDGIYLPDLGRSATEERPEALEADPFDRLQSEREAMVAQAGRVPGHL